jgi:hypothetical protein
MLNTKPMVKEPENAKQFELKEGGVKFENIKFKHLIIDN